MPDVACLTQNTMMRQTANNLSCRKRCAVWYVELADVRDARWVKGRVVRVVTGVAEEICRI